LGSRQLSGHEFLHRAFIGRSRYFILYGCRCPITERLNQRDRSRTPHQGTNTGLKTTDWG
jgi:hypothetical protein